MKTLFTALITVLFLSITSISVAQYDKIPPPSKTLKKLVDKQNNAQNQLKLKQNDDKFQNLDKQASQRDQLNKDVADRQRALEAQQTNEMKMAQTPEAKAKLALKHKGEKERLAKETNLKINTLEKNATNVNSALDRQQANETNKLLTKQDSKFNKEVNKFSERIKTNERREAQGKNPLLRVKNTPERKAEKANKALSKIAKSKPLPPIPNKNKAPNKPAPAVPNAKKAPNKPAPPVPIAKKAPKKPTSKAPAKTKTKVRKRKGN